MQPSQGLERAAPMFRILNTNLQNLIPHTLPHISLATAADRRKSHAQQRPQFPPRLPFAFAKGDSRGGEGRNLGFGRRRRGWEGEGGDGGGEGGVGGPKRTQRLAEPVLRRRHLTWLHIVTAEAYTQKKRAMHSTSGVWGLKRAPAQRSVEVQSKSKTRRKV